MPYQNFKEDTQTHIKENNTVHVTKNTSKFDYTSMYLLKCIMSCYAWIGEWRDVSPIESGDSKYLLFFFLYGKSHDFCCFNSVF